MTTVKDVAGSRLVGAIKEELKKEGAVKPPAWAEFVKTGAGKDRPPEQEDWWFSRSAALLRKVYLQGPIGTSRLRKEFSSRKNRGHKPEKSYRAGGAIIRKALTQLAEAGFVRKEGNQGRVVTPKGRSLLDNTAHRLRTS